MRKNWRTNVDKNGLGGAVAEGEANGAVAAAAREGGDRRWRREDWEGRAHAQ